MVGVARRGQQTPTTADLQAWPAAATPPPPLPFSLLPSFLLIISSSLSHPPERMPPPGSIPCYPRPKPAQARSHLPLSRWILTLAFGRVLLSLERQPNCCSGLNVSKRPQSQAKELPTVWCLQSTSAVLPDFYKQYQKFLFKVSQATQGHPIKTSTSNLAFAFILTPHRAYLPKP